MTALALDVAELPEVPEAADHRAKAIAAGLCPQCGHPDGAEHDLYGTHCRWTGPGRLECMCEGPLTERRHP